MMKERRMQRMNRRDRKGHKSMTKKTKTNLPKRNKNIEERCFEIKNICVVNSIHVNMYEKLILKDLVLI